MAAYARHVIACQVCSVMLTAVDVHVGIHHQSHDEIVQLGHKECQVEQLTENLMMEEYTATHVHAMH